jgi:hypothetical protein
MKQAFCIFIRGKRLMKIVIDTYLKIVFWFDGKRSYWMYNENRENIIFYGVHVL